MTGVEYAALLDQIECYKGRFLRRLNKELGEDFLGYLKTSGRVVDLPLLQMSDEEMMKISDCDPKWVHALRNQTDEMSQ